MAGEVASGARRNLDAARAREARRTGMRLVHDYSNVPADAQRAVLAIGNFDGVHRGHQALIAAAAKTAKASGRPAGVLIFEPHPREFFHPEEPHFRLTPLREKLTIFESLGLDLAIVLDFDKA